MGRDRLGKAKSEVCYRKPHRDIEELIRWLMMPENNTTYTGRQFYRNAKVCRRHLLIDKESTRLKRRSHRIARRVAKEELRQLG